MDVHTPKHKGLRKRLEKIVSGKSTHIALGDLGKCLSLAGVTNMSIVEAHNSLALNGPNAPIARWVYIYPMRDGRLDLDDGEAWEVVTRDIDAGEIVEISCDGQPVYPTKEHSSLADEVSVSPELRTFAKDLLEVLPELATLQHLIKTIQEYHRGLFAKEIQRRIEFQMNMQATRTSNPRGSGEVIDSYD